MQDQFRKLCPRTTCQEGDAIQGAHAEWGQTLGLSIQGIWCHSAMDSDHPRDPRFTGREIEAPAGLCRGLIVLSHLDVLGTLVFKFCSTPPKDQSQESAKFQ